MTKLSTNRLLSLLPLTAIILLAACASSPPKPTVDFKPDYNFAGVQKLAFYYKSGDMSGSNPVPISDMARNRVDLALKTAFTNKGYQVVEDASAADLLISWHVVTQEKTDVRTYQTPGMGMGYSRYGGYNRYSMYNCWGCMSQTEVSVQNYTEGTFIVDLIDPKLKQSVWRSLIQERLKGEMGQDQQQYNAAAENIVASFPPP